MQEVTIFIEEARKKKLNDQAIRSALEAKGWDKTTIDMALAGLEAPSPQQTKNSPLKSTSSHTSKPSLSPVLAALHHVILWFFTASSAVTIGGTVATLYGSNLDSKALASMIAVTLITFIPYAILFGTFLKKARQNPLLIPGKVWSIITICLHSIGAMIAAIVAVVALITDGDIRVLVSALLILGLDLLVVAVYSLAAFSDNRHTLRKVILNLHLPLLILLFGTLFGLSVLKIGPIKHDEQVREALASTVRNIATYTENNKRLPESSSQIEVKPGVEYKKISDSTYEVCAIFQTSVQSTAREYDYYRSNSSIPNDDFVYEGMFNAEKSGSQCFTIKSYTLRNQNNQSSDML